MIDVPYYKRMDIIQRYSEYLSLYFFYLWFGWSLDSILTVVPECNRPLTLPWLQDFFRNRMVPVQSIITCNIYVLNYVLKRLEENYQQNMRMMI